MMVNKILMNHKDTLDLDPGSQVEPMNSWCVSFAFLFFFLLYLILISVIRVQNIQ